ncbi:predicted protein [Nematostella vectensis]|uniref:SH2 domain-containing protein n=1 Tax=Nematostella vectensis TaxID=45351 RepID=A7RGQ1_NEMVE|nr:predicted protein [Nematostella vectensis]|eukprot:XP_001641513.1 predicted protein [Nematostella vectensis]
MSSEKGCRGLSGSQRTSIVVVIPLDGFDKCYSIVAIIFNIAKYSHTYEIQQPVSSSIIKPKTFFCKRPSASPFDSQCQASDASSGVYTAATGVAGSSPLADNWDAASVSKSSQSSGKRLTFESPQASSSPRPSSAKDRQLAHLLNHTPNDVRNFSWKFQRQIAELLNPRKEPTGEDWRMVASNLGIKAATIRTLESKENPTMELLNLCHNTTTVDFFRAIDESGRFDVISDLLEKLSLEPPSNKLPTQESLDDSTSTSVSGISLPPDESFGASSGRSRLSKTPSEHREDESDDEIMNVIERHLTQESREFWRSIPGVQHQHKINILWIVLDVPEERDTKDVSLLSFCRLVAWFGPMVPGKGGALHKIHELMTKSLSKSNIGKQSWFAGHMDETESERLLRDLSPGHFLIRFSTSRADDGFFVLAVKTRDNGVVQVQIESSPREGLLILGGEVFQSLVEIVEKLRNETLLEDCRQLLINPCPNLPLNAIFSGYGRAGPIRGRPRGRGRGRDSLPAS